MFELTGKNIVITGGCGLIGAQLCRDLSSYEANIIIADVDEERGEQLASTLENAQFQLIDITDPDSVASAFTDIAEEFGPIDGLVNAAYPRTGNYGNEFKAVAPSDWNENLRLHLGGYYTACREAALRMLKSDTEGSIVNIGSIYGIRAPDFRVYNGTDMTSPVEYSAIKAGIIHLTRYLASYLGRDNIRVNAVSPGGVYNNQPAQFVENYEDRVPLGRMARSEDISGAVVYLLSDAASYVTGHNLVVDGGWSIR